MRVVAGIDVGGTNTDAVLVADGKIVARAKVPTTYDVCSGMVAALARIPDAAAAARVHIGTTAFTNALVERRELTSAGAIRAGKPVSESLPPMTDWPDDLLAAVHNRSYFINGGREYDGRPISPLDRYEVTQLAREFARIGITQVAVTSVFGTSYPEDELRISEWMAAENHALQCSLSHRRILERENGAMLLIRLAHSEVANAYGAAMAQIGGEADLTLSVRTMSRQEALDHGEREAQRRRRSGCLARLGHYRRIGRCRVFISYRRCTPMQARAVGDIEERSR